MTAERWSRRLEKLGLELRVLEREIDDGPDGVVGSWVAFVSPRGLPEEPFYFPPIGVGSNVERELAISGAVIMYVEKEAASLSHERAYFERHFGGALPRIPW